MDFFSNLTALNIFLFWLAIFCLSLFIYVSFRYKKSNSKLDQILNDEGLRWRELELKAQNDYQQIIEAANKKAQEITFSAAKINNESQVNFQNTIALMLNAQKQELQNASDSLLKTHQQEVDALNKHIIELSTNIYKDIENEAKKELEDFITIAKKQTFDAENIAQQRIKEEYAKLEKEIQQRREQHLVQLEQNIYKILSSISKDIIGKSLDLSAHEDLIIKSLNEAKKEGVL